MNPAVLSLIALIVALALSMTSRINVGWLALSFAWDMTPDYSRWLAGPLATELGVSGTEGAEAAAAH